MGAIGDECLCSLEMVNEVKIRGSSELGVEKEPETIAIKAAVRVLLEGLGEDIDREGIRKTPLRVAKALREGTKGYGQNAGDIINGALFPEVGLESGAGHAGGMGGLVIVRDLDFFSYCESCLLQFQVKCHVGYVSSGNRVLGLSKFSRVADIFAKRLQDPHRLADEICKALHDGVKPAGVAVLLQCSHIQFPRFESALLDSNHNGWTKMTVTSGSGIFEDEKAYLWSEFLALLKFRDIKTANGHFDAPVDQSWCPSLCALKIVPANPAMITAVASILQSLGEDPLRKELVGTPARFLTWMTNFRNCNLEMQLNRLVRTHKDSLKPEGTAQLNEEHIRSEHNLSFWSQCEHHLLPFYGDVHIGYYSSEEVNLIGRSLLQSIVHFYGFKLQVQERLTRQIAETVSLLLGEDVMVVVEAHHTCMISRGVEKFDSSTATVAVLGQFSTDFAARAKFLKSIPIARPSKE